MSEQITEEHDENICNICLEPINDDGQGDQRPSRIDCDHVFHKSCIDSWFNTSGKIIYIHSNPESYQRYPGELSRVTQVTCPVCRLEFNQVNEENTDDESNNLIIDRLNMVKFRYSRSWVLWFTGIGMFLSLFTYIGGDGSNIAPIISFTVHMIGYIGAYRLILFYIYFYIFVWSVSFMLTLHTWMYYIETTKDQDDIKITNVISIGINILYQTIVMTFATNLALRLREYKIRLRMLINRRNESRISV
jgi:hypothetical protein